MDKLEIFLRFSHQGSVLSIVPYGNGHINDTFLVKTDQGQYDYILQRINHHIFTNVQGLMRNIEVVTSHLRKKLQSMPGHDAHRETLNLVYTPEGEPFIQDIEGYSWRVFLFIPGMKIYEEAPNAEVAREAGRIIGLFQDLLSDLPEQVTDTLPGFHSIHRRENEYREAFTNDPKNRMIKAKEEILFIEDRLPIMRSYYDTFEKTGIPRRIVHYDTKINNILFDEGDKAMCLIDLDTLCPGYVHFDFGDALRTLANTAAEDERDLERVSFNVPYYKAFSEGYLSEADRFLSGEEKELLPFSPIYLTFLIGLRFMADYLNGDTYYKIKYGEHNLVRARVQFRLVHEMERYFGRTGF